MTTAPLLDDASHHVDQLLEAICAALQITPTQFELAKGHYEAVGQWLAKPDSPLAQSRPHIYPQGSMALRTTTRPRGREEYDLDMVMQVEPISSDPMDLYRRVEERLKTHGDYVGRLEKKRRCLRLTYEHRFHLDILPARRDDRRGGTCIEVPDCDLRAWKPSNALGYIRWFEERCEVSRVSLQKREVAPLAQPISADLLVVLRQVVQLLKRRRDNMFYETEDAPRSVILTTLAALFYEGEPTVIEAMVGIAQRFEQAVASAAPGRFRVLNPTNPAEDFSESWDNPTTYEKFVRFVQVVRMEFGTLLQTQGLDRLGALLDDMFGDTLGQTAVRAYLQRVRDAKEADALRFRGPALVLGSERGHRPNPHTFHHGA